MGILGFIKNIIEKIKRWFKNLFRKKKKKTTISYKELSDKEIKQYANRIGLIDDAKNSTLRKNSILNDIYMKINDMEYLTLENKLKFLKNNIVKGKKKKGLQIVNSINKTIKEEPIYINQIDEILDLIEKATVEVNEKLDATKTNEKLTTLKDNIEEVICRKYTKYEKEVLDKASREYDKVNYVIMTTLIIDDITKEIEEIIRNIEKNKYTKYEYKRQINRIKDKIEEIEKLYDKTEIGEELFNLKKDFYTKSKDKYDLLYNKEIFINLNRQCDELLEKINQEEKEEVNTKEKEKKEEKEKEKEKEEKEKKADKKEKITKEDQEFIDNILKRFLDLKIANKILLERNSNYTVPKNVNELLKQIDISYGDFLQGEEHKFNFLRNKQKTEIVKLYNDLTFGLCLLQRQQFMPLEHINIPLKQITELTLERHTLLSDLMENGLNYHLNEKPNIMQTEQKLTNIIQLEHQKENLHSRKLIKTYQGNRHE